MTVRQWFYLAITREWPTGVLLALGFAILFFLAGATPA